MASTVSKASSVAHTKVTLKHNPNFKRNGLMNYLRAMRKYNFAPTLPGPYTMVAQVESRGNQAIQRMTGRKIGGKSYIAGHVLAKKDAATGQTGRVPATDVEQNSEYLAPVSIGTPAQTLNLDFDTGSADLWVFSTLLSDADQTATTTDGKPHAIFNPTKSSTYHAQSDSTWSISYGDGSSASGDVGTDNVTLGGIVVENQAIELAKTLSSEFVSGAGDGLLGLAWGKINTVKPTPVQTPVENMISQKDIDQPNELFTAWLDNMSGSSWYTFGYIDQDALGGQTPSYTPVDNSNGFWQFASASAAVGGKTIARAGNSAIADTGTTLCLVDDATCHAIYDAIPNAKQDPQQQAWVLPTNTADADLPAVAFAVGDKLFQIAPADLKFQDLGNGFTYGGVQSRGDMQDFDILGDVFLRSIYAIFDQGNKRFGAVQRGAAATTTTTTTGGASAAGAATTRAYSSGTGTSSSRSTHPAPTTSSSHSTAASTATTTTSTADQPHHNPDAAPAAPKKRLS